MPGIVGAHYIVTATSLNLRSTADSGNDDNIVGSIPGGAAVELVAETSDAWWKVRTSGGDQGFVAKRYLAPLSAGAIPMFEEANLVLWKRTKAAAGAVKYQLGAKRSSLGVIDCSGWVCEITEAAFQVINSQSGEVVFDTADVRALHDHSDGIISNVEKRTGKILKGDAVSIDNLRPGMLIGIDTGLKAFEKDQERKYGIDHIVQVISNPETGTLSITQSSSSGGGVNAVPLAGWLARWRERGLMSGGRIFATDPFAMADENTAYVRELVA